MSWPWTDLVQEYDMHLHRSLREFISNDIEKFLQKPSVNGSCALPFRAIWMQNETKLPNKQLSESTRCWLIPLSKIHWVEVI